MRIRRTNTINLLMAAAFVFSAKAGPAWDNVPDASVPVHMVVTGEALDGKDLPALSREDIVVHQGKDRLKVTNWSSLPWDQSGLQLFLLIDDVSDPRFGSYMDELRQFITSRSENTSIAVGYMRNGAVDIRRNFTMDHAQAAADLRLPMGINDVGSPYLSLRDLIRRWPPSNERRAIVIMTDGIDRFGGFGLSNPYVDIAIEAAQRAGIMIYAIYTPGIGHYAHSFRRISWGQNYLSQIAEETGGDAYSLGIATPDSCLSSLKDIARHLNHQYLLTFLAKPGDKAALQSVKLTTEVPNAELVTATKVYVPGERAEVLGASQ